MSMDDTSRAIGALEAGQTATNKRLDNMELVLKGQDDKLDRILAHQQQQKGERKATAVIASAVGSALGLAIGWFHK